MVEEENKDHQFGHLLLPININQHEDLSNRKNSTIDRELYLRFESLESELIIAPAMNRAAILNFRGLLAFRLNKLEIAKENFEKVLEEDEENLNAIQNLSCITGGDPGRFEDLMTLTLLDVNKWKNNRKIASSLAEQAIAFAYDVMITNDEDRIQKLEESIQMFDRAFDIGSSMMTKTETFGWYYWMLIFLMRIDDLMKRSPDPEIQKNRLPIFNRALCVLKELQKSEEQIYQALSSSLLGVMLERQQVFKSTPISIHDCGFTGLESLQCFSRSIQIAEPNITVLNKLSEVFLNFEKYELALGTANMSLEIDPSNHHLLHMRARIHTTIYMRELARCKIESCVMPAREVLYKAKEDLEKVLIQKPSLRAYMDIGQTSYYIGVDSLSELMLVDEDSINQALVYFSKALDCERGESLPELQVLRGNCMRLIGEEDNALECFKRSILLEAKGSVKSEAFISMLEIYMNWFCQSSEKKREEIVEEVDEWLQKALQKFDNGALKVHFRGLVHRQPQQVLLLCKGTIKSAKFGLSRICFQTFSV